MKFSLRSILFLTAAIAVLLFFTLEYRHQVRACGGCDQRIELTSIASNIKRIEYAPIHFAQSHEYVVDAFSTVDLIDVESVVGPQQVYSVRPNGMDLEISIPQAWSIQETGLTRRRTHYQQTYRYLVLNVVPTNGPSRQYTIGLSEYGRAIKIDLSSERDNSSQPSDHQ